MPTGFGPGDVHVPVGWHHAFVETTFPAVDFPLYGVDETSWQGPRWLNFLEGQAGTPAWALWLHHGFTPAPDATRPWVRVGNLPRERHARLMTPTGGDPAREVAFAALFSLANLTLPASNDRPEVEDYLQQLVAYVEAQADRYAEWPAVTWRIDEIAVSAHVRGWAGAWAGFTTELGEVDVVTLGYRVPVEDLVLTELVDTSAYHFDAERPILFPEACNEARTAALGARRLSEAAEVWWPLTPDHRRPVHPRDRP